MTFVEPTTPPPTPGLIVAYALLTLTSLLASARAYHLGSTRSHYRHVYTVRFLFPLACLMSALENATLASSGRFSNPESGKLTSAQSGFLGFVYACQALEVPILLLSTFELTYLTHKRRSVNFCGMYFDEGRRVREARVVTNSIKSFVLRNFVRAVAMLCLALGIVVNFDLLGDVTRVDDLAGRCGWVCLFTDGRVWDDRVHLLLSLVPTAVLIVCNSYFSFLLWRYGTESSMVVHASILNPWFSLSVGNAALAAGQIFGYPPTFSFTSNLGLIVFVVSTLLLMSEVDKDMVAADDFADFLGQVARKGDEISMVGGTAAAADGGAEPGTAAAAASGTDAPPAGGADAVPAAASSSAAAGPAAPTPPPPPAAEAGGAGPGAEERPRIPAALGDGPGGEDAGGSSGGEGGEGRNSDGGEGAGAGVGVAVPFGNEEEKVEQQEDNGQ